MLKKNSKIELEQFLLETDTPRGRVSLAKRLLLAGILICISASAVAEEPPIGLVLIQQFATVRLGQHQSKVLSFVL